MMRVESLLTDLAEEVRTEASHRIPVTDVKFAINEGRSGIVPEIGVGGACFESSTVSLDVRPDIDLGDKRCRQLIRYTVAHELHHAARWRSVGCGAGLGEALVSEGFADHFAREIAPTVTMPWTRPMHPLSRWICHVQLPFVLHRRHYCRRTWFFRGSGWRGIPRWAGYSLGFEIVGAFLRARRRSASDCHATSASEVLQENAYR